MNRRVFVALMPALALAACAQTGLAPPAPTGTPTSTPPVSGPSAVAIANDVALIATSLKNAVAILSTSTTPLPPQVSTALVAALNLIQSAAQDYATANSLAGQQTAVQELEAGVAALTQAFTANGMQIPSSFTPYLLAASALLPAIELFVGLPAPAPKGAALGMTPDEARKILRGAK